jgi:uncharacterized integral membrane protein
MTRNILEILIITVVLIFIIEYIKFFSETKLPLFFKYSRIPLIVYIIAELIIGISCIGIISFGTDYEYPRNIIYIPFISSAIPTGIISNIEFYMHNNEINIFRKHLNEYRNDIISDIKKNETFEIRNIGCELAKSLSCEELKNNCRIVNERQCVEIENKHKDDEAAQKSMYALEIAIKDPKFAKSLYSKSITAK